MRAIVPAQWLSDHGVAAFVLKYRLAREEGSTYTVDGHALIDIQRAIRLVRSRAKEWGLDTSRIGVMGFSAGGELAALSAMKFSIGKKESPDPVEREGSRPDFSGADLSWRVQHNGRGEKFSAPISGRRV